MVMTMMMMMLVLMVVVAMMLMRDHSRPPSLPLAPSQQPLARRCSCHTVAVDRR